MSIRFFVSNKTKSYNTYTNTLILTQLQTHVQFNNIDLNHGVISQSI